MAGTMPSHHEKRDRRRKAHQVEGAGMMELKRRVEDVSHSTERKSYTRCSFSAEDFLALQGMAGELEKMEKKSQEEKKKDVKDVIQVRDKKRSHYFFDLSRFVFGEITRLLKYTVKRAMINDHLNLWADYHIALALKEIQDKLEDYVDVAVQCYEKLVPDDPDPMDEQGHLTLNEQERMQFQHDIMQRQLNSVIRHGESLSRKVEAAQMKHESQDKQFRLMRKQFLKEVQHQKALNRAMTKLLDTMKLHNTSQDDVESINQRMGTVLIFNQDDFMDQEELDFVQERVKMLQHQHEAEVHMMRKVLQEEINGLQQDLEKESETRIQLEMRIEHMNHQLKEIESHHMKAELGKFGQMEGLKEDLSNMDDLKSELEQNLENEKKMTLHLGQKLQKQLATIQTLHDLTLRQYQVLSDSVHGDESYSVPLNMLSDMKERLSDAEEEWKALCKETVPGFDPVASHKEALHEDLETQVEHLKNQLSTVIYERDALKEQLPILKSKKVREMQHKMIELQSSSPSALAELKAENEKLKERSDGLDEVVAKLSVKLDKAESHVKELERKETFQETFQEDDMVLDGPPAPDPAALLEKALAEATTKYEGEIDFWKERALNGEQEVESLQTQLESLQTQLESLQTQLESSQQEKELIENEAEVTASQSQGTNWKMERWEVEQHIQEAIEQERLRWAHLLPRTSSLPHLDNDGLADGLAEEISESRGLGRHSQFDPLLARFESALKSNRDMNLLSGGHGRLIRNCSTFNLGVDSLEFTDSGHMPARTSGITQPTMQAQGDQSVPVQPVGTQSVQNVPNEELLAMASDLKEWHEDIQGQLKAAEFRADHMERMLTLLQEQYRERDVQGQMSWELLQSWLQRCETVFKHLRLNNVIDIPPALLTKGMDDEGVQLELQRLTSSPLNDVEAVLALKMQKAERSALKHTKQLLQVINHESFEEAKESFQLAREAKRQDSVEKKEGPELFLEESETASHPASTGLKLLSGKVSAGLGKVSAGLGKVSKGFGNASSDQLAIPNSGSSNTERIVEEQTYCSQAISSIDQRLNELKDSGSSRTPHNSLPMQKSISFGEVASKADDDDVATTVGPDSDTEDELETDETDLLSAINLAMLSYSGQVDASIESMAIQHEGNSHDQEGHRKTLMMLNEFRGNELDVEDLQREMFSPLDEAIEILDDDGELMELPRTQSTGLEDMHLNKAIMEEMPGFELRSIHKVIPEPSEVRKLEQHEVPNVMAKKTRHDHIKQAKVKINMLGKLGAGMKKATTSSRSAKGLAALCEGDDEDVPEDKVTASTKTKAPAPVEASQTTREISIPLGGTPQKPKESAIDKARKVAVTAATFMKQNTLGLNTRDPNRPVPTAAAPSPTPNKAPQTDSQAASLRSDVNSPRLQTGRSAGRSAVPEKPGNPPGWTQVTPKEPASQEPASPRLGALKQERLGRNPARGFARQKTTDSLTSSQGQKLFKPKKDMVVGSLTSMPEGFRLQKFRDTARTIQRLCLSPRRLKGWEADWDSGLRWAAPCSEEARGGASSGLLAMLETALLGNGSLGSSAPPPTKPSALPTPKQTAPSTTNQSNTASTTATTTTTTKTETKSTTFQENREVREIDFSKDTAHPTEPNDDSGTNETSTPNEVPRMSGRMSMASMGLSQGLKHAKKRKSKHSTKNWLKRLDTKGTGDEVFVDQDDSEPSDDELDKIAESQELPRSKTNPVIQEGSKAPLRKSETAPAITTEAYNKDSNSEQSWHEAVPALPIRNASPEATPRSLLAQQSKWGKMVPQQFVAWLKLNLMQRQQAILYAHTWTVTELEVCPELTAEKRDQMLGDFEEFLMDVMCLGRPTKHQQRQGLRHHLKRKIGEQSSSGMINRFAELADSFDEDATEGLSRTLNVVPWEQYQKMMEFQQQKKDQRTLKQFSTMSKPLRQAVDQIGDVLELKQGEDSNTADLVLRRDLEDGLPMDPSHPENSYLPRPDAFGASGAEEFKDWQYVIWGVLGFPLPMHPSSQLMGQDPYCLQYAVDQGLNISTDELERIHEAQKEKLKSKGPCRAATRLHASAKDRTPRHPRKKEPRNKEEPRNKKVKVAPEMNLKVAPEMHQGKLGQGSADDGGGPSLADTWPSIANRKLVPPSPAGTSMRPTPEPAAHEEALGQKLEDASDAVQSGQLQGSKKKHGLADAPQAPKRTEYVADPQSSMEQKLDKLVKVLRTHGLEEPTNSTSKGRTSKRYLLDLSDIDVQLQLALFDAAGETKEEQEIFVEHMDSMKMLMRRRLRAVLRTPGLDPETLMSNDLHAQELSARLAGGQVQRAEEIHDFMQHAFRLLLQKYSAAELLLRHSFLRLKHGLYDAEHNIPSAGGPPSLEYWRPQPLRNRTSSGSRPKAMLAPLTPKVTAPRTLMSELPALSLPLQVTAPLTPNGPLRGGDQDFSFPETPMAASQGTPISSRPVTVSRPRTGASQRTWTPKSTQKGTVKELGANPARNASLFVGAVAWSYAGERPWTEAGSGLPSREKSGHLGGLGATCPSTTDVTLASVSLVDNTSSTTTLPSLSAVDDPMQKTLKAVKDSSRGSGAVKLSPMPGRWLGEQGKSEHQRSLTAR